MVAGEDLARTTMPVHPISATFAMILLSALYRWSAARMKEKGRKEVAVVCGHLRFRHLRS